MALNHNWVDRDNFHLLGDAVEENLEAIGKTEEEFWSFLGPNAGKPGFASNMLGLMVQLNALYKTCVPSGPMNIVILDGKHQGECILTNVKGGAWDMIND